MKYDHLDMLPERAFQPHSKYGMTLEGGGGGPSTSTTYTSNIPDWLRPQTEAFLGAATQEYFNVDSEGNITGVKPYTPYSTRPEDYVAGFSPQQEAVFREAAGMQRPGQFQDATQLAGMAGRGGLESAQQAYGYGQAGYESGMLGQQLGLQAAQQAEQRAQQAEQAAYGYGAQGQQSGLLGQQLGAMGGQRFGEMGAGYGQQAAGMAPEAQMYGRRAANIGEMALAAQDYGRDVGEQARRYAQQAAMTGRGYESRATSPGAIQAYMSPYQQNVIDLQKQNAIRENAIRQAELGSQAARAGAFGGGRQAIQRAEAERALQSTLANIEAQGLQSAYDRAIQSMQYGTGQGLQGLQAAQSGLGTALQGGQLGLSGIGQAIAGQQAGLSGLGQAGQLYGLGIQGAQAGLSGIDRQLAGTAQGMQGAQVGLQGVDRALASGQLSLAGTDRGLAGTGQGMQGAQVGLQGVSGAQAGYGLANQAGTNLSNIAAAQQRADLERMGFQQEMGGMQQGREQQIINQAVQNYAMAQENPMQRLAGYSGLIRGYATPTTSVSQYAASPSFGQTAAGAGSVLYGLSQMKKKGGKIKDDGIDSLALYNVMKKRRAA